MARIGQIRADSRLPEQRWSKFHQERLPGKRGEITEISLPASASDGPRVSDTPRRRELPDDLAPD